jgi:D-proline reductase (dithiol) PrdB
MDVLPFDIADLEAQWTAYNERSLVSHAGLFVPTRNGALAFHVLAKPAREIRVALVSTGGVHAVDQPPFDLVSHAGDDTVRWIPGDVDVSRLRFAHDHYDHTDPDTDPNCMFPIERLRELAAEGAVGSVARWHAGCMGFIPDPSRFRSETVPEIAARLRDDGVDAAVFSPG